MQLQVMDSQIKEMHQQLQVFQTQTEEIKNIITGLDDFKEVKQGTSILVPLSSGIFARAALEENKSLLMNVGAGVVVNKNIDDVKKLLSQQIDKLMKLQEGMTMELNKLASKALPLQEEINSLK